MDIFVIPAAQWQCPLSIVERSAVQTLLMTTCYIFKYLKFS
jgi:hypothetical protein